MKWEWLRSRWLLALVVLVLVVAWAVVQPDITPLGPQFWPVPRSAQP